MDNNKATVITRFRFKSKEDALASLNRITGLEFSSMPVSLVNRNPKPGRQNDAALQSTAPVADGLLLSGFCG